MPRVRPGEREVLGALPGLRPRGTPSVKAVLDSFRDGYNWPRDWNWHMHTLGYHHAVLDIPRRHRRIGRGITWAWYTLASKIARKIDPDQ